MNLKMSLFLISKLPIRLGTLGVVRLVGFPNRFFFRFMVFTWFKDQGQFGFYSPLSLQDNAKITLLVLF